MRRIRGGCWRDWQRALIDALTLSSGIETSLDAKPRSALAALGASNSALACSDLLDVISQANAFVGQEADACRCGGRRRPGRGDPHADRLLTARRS
jgi:hypothetical protein